MSDIPEPPGSAQADGLAGQIRQALLTGNGATAIVSLYQQRAQTGPADAAHVLLAAASVCWEMRRKKETRSWLEQFAASRSEPSASDMVSAIEIAAAAGQAELVLGLCGRLSQSHHVIPRAFEHTAHTVIALALRMRLPGHRNGAWAVHRDLLRAILGLLNTMSSHDPEDGGRQPVMLLQERVQQLLQSS